MTRLKILPKDAHVPHPRVIDLRAIGGPLSWNKFDVYWWTKGLNSVGPKELTGIPHVWLCHDRPLRQTGETEIENERGGPEFDGYNSAP